MTLRPKVGYLLVECVELLYGFRPHPLAEGKVQYVGKRLIVIDGTVALPGVSVCI